MPLLTVRAFEAYRPKADPYKITLDRDLQLRIAPDGKRTLLVPCTVKGSNTECQYRLPQEYGDAPTLPLNASRWSPRKRTVAYVGRERRPAGEAGWRTFARWRSAPR